MNKQLEAGSRVVVTVDGETLHGTVERAIPDSTMMRVRLETGSIVYRRPSGVETLADYTQRLRAALARKLAR